jgi:hypothetical protein
MRRSILALILLLLACPALAGELMMKNAEGLELRLYDAACSHGETLALLKPEWRPKFKNARIRNAKGHMVAYGCWIQDEEGVATVILSDGAMLELALSGFTDPTI